MVGQAPDQSGPGAALTEVSSGDAQFVYAIGNIEPRFPSLAVEKELAQALGRDAGEGMTDQEATVATLANRSNRYIARSMCWVLTIQGLETYILVPRDPVDVDQLIDSLRANPSPADIDVVIGVQGPLAPATMCNGLVLPLLGFDQIYSFDRHELIAALPKPEKADAKAFERSANELVERVVGVADNAGATDEHRAINYLLVRYPGLYEAVTSAHDRNATFSSVEARLSTTGGARRIADVILSFTDRRTNVVDKSYVRVDVTEEYPFLVAGISSYIER